MWSSITKNSEPVTYAVPFFTPNAAFSSLLGEKGA